MCAVLHQVEEFKARNPKPEELMRKVEKLLSKVGLNGRNHEEVRRDELSHFILRLAYCRT